MKERIEDTILKTLFRIEPVSEEQMAQERRRRQQAPPRQLQHVAPPKVAANPKPQGTVVRQDKKVGRNEPCPCGSGKKFKKCHGALQRRELAHRSPGRCSDRGRRASNPRLVPLGRRDQSTTTG